MLMLISILKGSTNPKTVQITSVFNPKSKYYIWKKTPGDSSRPSCRPFPLHSLSSVNICLIPRKTETEEPTHHLPNPQKNSCSKTPTHPLPHSYKPSWNPPLSSPNSSSSANGYKKPRRRRHPQKLTRVTGDSPNIRLCRVYALDVPTRDGLVTEMHPNAVNRGDGAALAGDDTVSSSYLSLHQGR
jgi:hypothetical protein